MKERYSGSIIYDALGRESTLTQIRDIANRFTQTTTYDVANRVSTVTVADKTGKTQRQISYGYAYSADAQSRPQLTVTSTLAGDTSFNATVFASEFVYAEKPKPKPSMAE